MSSARTATGSPGPGDAASWRNTVTKRRAHLWIARTIHAGQRSDGAARCLRFSNAAPRQTRPVGLLTATRLAFNLEASSVELAAHLIRSQTPVRWMSCGRCGAAHVAARLISCIQIPVSMLV